MEKITTNIGGAATRWDKMDGKDYLVAPMVMLVEGVLNGSNGPLYYPSAEIKKTPVVWNHKPIVVYHPTEKGVGVSACSPHIIETCGIGLIMNADIDSTIRGTTRLKAEAWIDPDKANKVDARIMNSLDAGKMMEISTGLFTDNEHKDGEYNGKKYVAIARNYRPDHLAILPDQIGACSIKDGAGLLRNSGKGNTPMKEKMVNQLISNAASPWGEEDREFLMAQSESKLKAFIQQNVKGGGTVTEDSKTTDAQKKQKQIQDDANTGDDDDDEDEEEMIDLKPSPRSKKKDGPMANKKKSSEHYSDEDSGDQDKMDAQKSAAEGSTKKAAVSNREVTVDSFLASAPASIRAVLTNGLQMMEERKAELIEKITANSANTFSEKYLQEQDVKVLEGIAALAESQSEKRFSRNTTTRNYSGQGEPVANKTVEFDALSMPTMNFSSKEE